jgi:hypothetical protein
MTMPLYTDLNAIRVRLHHYLSPEVGACAGLSQQELQQICAGTLIPTEKQQHALAIRMGLYPEPAR